MTDKRVKYFDTNDLMCGYNLEKIIYMDIPQYDDIEINDAIEYYEIHKYFKKNIIHKNWTKEEIKQYTDKSNELYKLTMRFFNSITDEIIISEYKKIDDFDYRSIFFELFVKCKLYNKISKDIFKQIVRNEVINPFDLFKYKEVVNQYGSILREYILSDLNNISIITHLYEQDFTNGEKLYRPKEITSDDICDYLLNYIKSENPNPNFLKSIMLMQPKANFQITDKIKLEAKRRYEKEKERILENSKQLNISMSIEFSENQVDEKKYDKVNNKIIYSYSKNWLKDTLDYPSILNNFIYIFEYVDCLQMRFNHVNKQSDEGLFERILIPRSSRIYPCNTIFDTVNMLAFMQMSIYYNFLKEHKIRLEDVLEYCFTEYFSLEFGMDKIKVKFPSEGTTYLEKCTLIFTVLETIIKQFSLYVKDENIDYELVSMSTIPMLFKNIPSFIENKYVYGNGDSFQKITYLLFSNQSELKYISRILEKEETYTSFYELISKEKIYLCDYNSSDKITIEYLKLHNIIEIADDGLLSIGDKYKAVILKDLFYNEVISRYHYSTRYQDIIDDLIDKKILKQKSSLFSDNEVNYLNYLLNRTEYENGLEIRNSYIHGNQHVIEDESKHEQNYYRILIIMVLLAIKINDDFCLNEKINKSEKNNT